MEREGLVDCGPGVVRGRCGTMKRSMAQKERGARNAGHELEVRDCPGK